MEISLFGYAGTGKTSLAAALIGKRIEGFDPGQPVESAVRMLDTRLRTVAAVVKPAKTTSPEFTLLDFKGAARETGFEERPLARLAASDAAVLVADAFAAADPAADLQSLCLEMVFRDADRLAKLAERRTAGDGDDRPLSPVEEAAVARARERLDAERFIAGIDAPPEEKTFLGSLGLLTLKPFVVAANGPAVPAGLAAHAGNLGLPAIGMDLSGPPPDESVAAFWTAVLRALDQMVFYTVGEKETRGWIAPVGTTAVEGAGKIHSDLAKGFVRAEVISYEDFVRLGCSHTACRNEGCMRLEMKEYVLRDGDVINIRFTR